MNTHQTIDFRSDNVAPAAEQVIRALAEAGREPVSPYGEDHETQGLAALFSEVFGRAAVGWPVPTGTAANAVTISGLLPEGGSLICHERAHALRSEEGATLHADPRIRFVALPGRQGRLDPSTCEAALRDVAGPKVLTLTQANEYGCAYDRDALSALGDVARRNGARLHLDGARLAAACCALDLSPRDMIAAARPDALSLGLSKVGAMNTDAAVFFDSSLPPNWRATMRRAGLLISKMRYPSIQIRTLMQAGLWLELARHSVEMCRYLRRGLQPTPGILSVHDSASNVLLVEFSETVQAALPGSPFLVKPGLDPGFTRLVTSHATQISEIDRLTAWLKEL
jgi:threonine aldolase